MIPTAGIVPFKGIISQCRVEKLRKSLYCFFFPVRRFSSHHRVARMAQEENDGETSFTASTIKPWNLLSFIDFHKGFEFSFFNPAGGGKKNFYGKSKKRLLLMMLKLTKSNEELVTWKIHLAVFGLCGKFFRELMTFFRVHFSAENIFFFLRPRILLFNDSFIRNSQNFLKKKKSFTILSCKRRRCGSSSSFIWLVST